MYLINTEIRNNLDKTLMILLYRAFNQIYFIHDIVLNRWIWLKIAFIYKYPLSKF